MQPILDVTHVPTSAPKTDLSGRDRVEEGHDPFQNAFKKERERAVETSDARPREEEKHQAGNSQSAVKPPSNEKQKSHLAAASPQSLKSPESSGDSVPVNTYRQLPEISDSMESMVAPLTITMDNTANDTDTELTPVSERDLAEPILLAHIEPIPILPESDDFNVDSIDVDAGLLRTPVIHAQDLNVLGNGSETQDGLGGRRRLDTLHFTASPLEGATRGVIAPELSDDTVVLPSSLSSVKSSPSQVVPLKPELTLLGKTNTVVSEKTLFETAMQWQTESPVDAKNENLETFARLAHSYHSAPTSHGVAQESRLQMPVNITFGKPEWGGMVAERAAIMAAQNITSAELQLDPPELGPLQVRVQVSHDQVTVSFVSANTNVRDALDQTAMRLRDLCDQQGMNLVDVNVSDHPHQDAESEQGAPSSNTAGSSVSDDENMEGETQGVSIQANGGIDSYV